jgi:hypothetical protein
MVIHIVRSIIFIHANYLAIGIGMANSPSDKKARLAALTSEREDLRRRLKELPTKLEEKRITTEEFRLLKEDYKEKLDDVQKEINELSGVAEKPKRVGPYCPNCSAWLDKTYRSYVGQQAFCRTCGKAYTVTKEMVEEVAPISPAPQQVQPPSAAPAVQQQVTVTHRSGWEVCGYACILLIVIFVVLMIVARGWVCMIGHGWIPGC